RERQRLWRYQRIARQLRSVPTYSLRLIPLVLFSPTILLPELARRPLLWKLAGSGREPAPILAFRRVRNKRQECSGTQDYQLPPNMDGRPDPPSPPQQNRQAA